MNETQVKVVILDDHPIVTTGIQALFNSCTDKKLEGVAHNSKDLMHLVRIATPDVILLDLNVPGDDYKAILKDLNLRYPHIHVIIYTSYNDPDLVKSVLKMGGSGYLLKETAPDEILTAVDAVMRGESYIGSSVRTSNAYARSDSEPNDLKDGFQKRLGLSKREHEILVLISYGLTSHKIGDKLFISKHTVETHRKNILRKLDVNNSTELVRLAVQHGLV